jgi:AraC-like DNA-binding protein
MLHSAGSTPATSCAPLSGRSMWIDPDRIFYAGLLGTPTVRGLGAYIVYVSAGAPFTIAMGNGNCRSAELAVTLPYEAHRITCSKRMVYQIVVEPETVDCEGLPDYMRGSGGAIDSPQLAARLRAACESIQANGYGRSAADFDFDHHFFDRCLPRREITGSIAEVVRRIKEDPAYNLAAEDCADAAHLSLSRFLHRFKLEVGVSFRNFRTWRRARNLMRFVGDDHNLAHLAQEIGYPDSTHFSHSVRKIYGMRPRDIFASSRHLYLYCKPVQGSYTA